MLVQGVLLVGPPYRKSAVGDVFLNINISKLSSKWVGDSVQSR